VTISKLDASAKIANQATRRFAREHADRLLGRLAFQVGRANKSHNSEAIHDLRVSIRRFGQALRVFKPCFRGKELRKVRRELKQVLDVAGELRNHDIALKLLGKSKRPERAALQAKIQIGRREARRSLVSLLKNWLDRKSSLKWRAALERAAADPRDNFGKVPIGQTARQMLPALAQDFFEHGNKAAGAKASRQELHGFRIASKKFRYTLELFTPLCGPALNPKLEAMRRVQTLLGDLNDLETLREILGQYQSNQNLTAWIKKRQRKRIATFCEYWTSTFASAEERQSWIDLLKHVGLEPRASKKPVARSTPGIRPLGRGAVA
jgi:CHAD domain-containing protein